MTTIHIACAADDKYLPHTAAMLHSLWWHNRDCRLCVHFLFGPELSVSGRARLERMAHALGFDLHFVFVPAEFVEGLPSRGYISHVVWYRIFMPQLLPELDRVLYLDGDVIAMDSIAPLWSEDLGTNYFAAVTNVVPDYHRLRASELGMSGPERYFNAGVALWNLRLMRGEGFTEQVLAYARDHVQRLLWLEQDILNVLYGDRRLPLHPRWNAQNGMFVGEWGTRLLDPQQLQEALQRPGLLHFEGGSFGKPWHFLSRHPLRERYYFHRRRTPWPFVIPEGINPKNIVIRYLPSPLAEGLRRMVRKSRRALSSFLRRVNSRPKPPRR